MAVTDADGIIYYRYIYDTYGELSDITTDDGVSLKTSEQLTEYRLAKLAHATGIDYLYNGQYGVETDSNGLYYMRARYYNQDIKRFINRDVVSGDIGNSQSLNRYCYVQGNPVSLTDPFGLCPDPNSNFKNFCKFLNNADWNALGHAALDVAGIFWEGADVINALWYAMEGNTEMAIASAIFAIPGLGIGVGNLLMKSDKLASAGKAVNAISKMTQSGMGIASGISIAKVGFTNMLNSIEAGEFNSGDLAMLIGGMAISAISGKGLVSSGKGLMDVLDGAGKTSKAGKGYLTDSDVNSMPIKSLKKSPSQIAQSWQGSGKYPGIDKYKDIVLKKGTIIYRGEPCGTEYFTTRSAIERCNRDATAIFEGLQVEKNPIHGYRENMQGYLVEEDIEVAFGITRANTQFGKGGLPQIFIPDVEALIQREALIPVDNIQLKK